MSASVSVGGSGTGGRNGHSQDMVLEVCQNENGRRRLVILPVLVFLEEAAAVVV